MSYFHIPVRRHNFQLQRISCFRIQIPLYGDLFLCFYICFAKRKEQLLISLLFSVWPRTFWQRHHIPAIVLCIVPAGKTISVKQQQQLFSVCFGHLIILFSIPKIPVHIFPVDTYDARRVFRPLHPSFDLQRIHAGLCNLRNQVYGTEIFWT